MWSVLPIVLLLQFPLFGHSVCIQVSIIFSFCLPLYYHPSILPSISLLSIHLSPLHHLSYFSSIHPSHPSSLPSIVSLSSLHPPFHCLSIFPPSSLPLPLHPPSVASPHSLCCPYIPHHSSTCCLITSFVTLSPSSECATVYVPLPIHPYPSTPTHPPLPINPYPSTPTHPLLPYVLLPSPSSSPSFSLPSCLACDQSGGFSQSKWLPAVFMSGDQLLQYKWTGATGQLALSKHLPWIEARISATFFNHKRDCHYVLLEALQLCCRHSQSTTALSHLVWRVRSLPVWRRERCRESLVLSE